jgi:elongation factor Tu
MPITSRPPDIEAEITFLSTENGGRRSAAKSGYRPTHDFGLDTLNDAAHEYIGMESVSPGQSARANLWLLVPEYQNGRLYPGFKFTVKEGPRIVGHGVVVAVINPILAKRI